MKKILFIFIIKLFLLILFLIDKIFRFFRDKRFLTAIHDKIEEKQYYNLKINKKKIKFFCPSSTTNSRVQSLFTKEPETLSWINNFENKGDEKIFFWDIGANIGLYSIYAATRFNNIEVIAFEPSTSNLRTLSRNISINNLHDKIKIFPVALNDKENIFSIFSETQFKEGGSISNFKNNIDYTGNVLEKNKIKNKYNIFGTNIDYLILNNIINIPNYIKIDVDGIEHLIIEGGKKLLAKKELKELSIEINNDYSAQQNLITELMKDNGFKKTSSTNAKFLNNVNYKRNFNESLNTVYKRN